MSLRNFIVHLLTCFGLLFVIIHLGLLLYFPTHDPSPTRRKFIVQYIDPKYTQNRINALHDTQYENESQYNLTERQFTPHDNLEPIPRPPLTSLVQGWNITGDVSWLIQFSIIGFPKSGTSTLMFHLRDHPEIHMFPHERCELSYNRQKILVEDMYRQFPSSSHTSSRFVRGIKCPLELENRQLALQNYQTFFPKTDFIVGIRHPILWYVIICLMLYLDNHKRLTEYAISFYDRKRFESFYNFRLQNKFPMPPAETLVGRCRKGWNNVCTNRANFHIFLSNLGKTNITTNMEEMDYVDVEMRKAINPIQTTRKVFLYEVSQLSDRNTERSLQFRHDLQQFLHLQQPIPPLIWFKPGQNRTADINHDKNFKQSSRIDICDERYDAIRSILLHHSKQASRWISKYFIHAEGVIVSSKTHFETAILKQWKVDPCVERRSRGARPG